MTAMTERDAKAAVREYLDMLGKPIGSDHAYTKFYNATHAWANSPDGPDAPNAANMEDTLRFYRLQSLERTKRRGFDGDNPLQWEWRKTDCRRDSEEIMDAVVDALTQEGIAAWPGDATSCVEQIVRVQYDRAETAEKALAEFKARVKEYIDVRARSWHMCNHTGNAFEKCPALSCIDAQNLLAECEPPAPPKPKFAAGNVVMDLVLGLPHKIVSCGEGVCEMSQEPRP